ncbi:rod shape-determining protein MreC [uncultured Parolsenella sp.]|uniref:rod shape-determining protein MreC n=1 Tax=uncultured Parolsenella sp. TaxID=2083008 RepID=UPI00265B527E|nr:rod shape-determining protein MreC [uncultured Parolsenella sp.]
MLSVISLALFVLGVREGDSGLLHGVRGVFQTVATPARVVGSVVASPVSGISNVVGNLTADSQTLSDLKAENDDLKAQVARLTEYEDEANTLTDLLQLRNQYSLDSTAARVIARSTDSWSSTITIDKGTTSGIQTGMPVMTSTGVVGQVSECGPTTATVRLITDESSGVSAKVQSSGAQGQLQGSADGTLHLNLIRTDQQVSTGDSVVTSGLGGVYPKGLPVGTVSNVTKSSGSLYYDITVEPLASVGSLEEVLVITSLSGDQQATADDATAANAQDRTTSTSATTAAATTDAAASDSSDQTDSSSSE